jgi:RsiW-degrading membrane proteinase PrsW (M82 family)
VNPANWEKIVKSGGKITCKHCGAIFFVSTDDQSVEMQSIVGSAGPKAENFKQSYIKDPATHAVTMSEDQFLNFLKKGQDQFNTMIGDLKGMDLKNELIPFDEKTLGTMFKNPLVWGLLFLGVVPLFIGTISNPRIATNTMILFFATVWAFIFKKVFLNYSKGTVWAIAAFLFTGFCGLPLLLGVYHILPEWYYSLSDNRDSMVRLFGYIGQVGICEELCKILPVIIYVYIKKDKAEPITVLLIGLFSGLGFAAFENFNYATLMVIDVLKSRTNSEVVLNTYSSMFTFTLRSFSCIFGHAIYSGIFSYFIAMACILGRKKQNYFLYGLIVAATVHGAYDWFLSVNAGTFAALVDVFGGVLFMAYYFKMKKISENAYSGLAE